MLDNLIFLVQHQNWRRTVIFALTVLEVIRDSHIHSKAERRGVLQSSDRKDGDTHIHMNELLNFIKYNI